MMASRKIEVGSGSGDASSSLDDKSILGGLDVPGMGQETGEEVGENE